MTAEKLRVETLYVDDLIAVLRTRAGGLRRWAVMQAIRRNRFKGRRPIPDRFEEGVESAFQQHCEDSAIHKKGSVPAKAALFHRPLGRDGGIWALHVERADAWLLDQSQQETGDLPGSRSTHTEEQQ